MKHFGMTREEAINVIKCNYPPENYSMLREALDMAVEDMTLHIPKAPIDNEERCVFECPTCGRIVVVYYDGQRSHCKCGQAIDWTGIE